MNGKYKTYLKITFLPTPASLKKKKFKKIDCLKISSDCIESIK